MPYESTKDLPGNLRERLPAGAEKAYASALNSAKSKGWDESRSHSYAWGAVKKNYRKSGDNWVKKAMANTDHEKQMLRTAKKLRRLVYADFMVKTANPAIAMLARSLAPALRSLGPDVLKMIKAVPAEAWAQIIPALIAQLAPKAPRAAEWEKPWEKEKAEDEEDDEEDDDGEESGTPVAAMANSLNKAGVTHPGVVARSLFLAAVETGAAHRKKANPVVTEALCLVDKMRSELKTIKEFN